MCSAACSPSAATADLCLAHAASGRTTAACGRCATVEASSAARAIGMAPCASRLVLGVWRGGWEALLGGSLCRLSVPVAGSLTSGSTWWCRPRSEQTGHDAGLQPALLGLSILPLSARHHLVACQATTRLAACPYRSDSLHFVAVYAVLPQWLPEPSVCSQVAERRR